MLLTIAAWDAHPRLKPVSLMLNGNLQPVSRNKSLLFPRWKAAWQFVTEVCRWDGGHNGITQCKSKPARDLEMQKVDGEGSISRDIVVLS